MYEARFHLGDFVQVEKELKEFDFSFRVQENNFALQLQPIEIEAGNPNVTIIKGSIRFSDKANSEQVGKMLSASNGAKITVSATTSPSLFEFAVAGIARAEERPRTHPHRRW